MMTHFFNCTYLAYWYWSIVTSMLLRRKWTTLLEQKNCWWPSVVGSIALCSLLWFCLLPPIQQATLQALSVHFFPSKIHILSNKHCQFIFLTKFYPTSCSTGIVSSFFLTKIHIPSNKLLFRHCQFFHHVPFWSIWHLCTKRYFYTVCLFAPFSIVAGTTRALWVYFAINFLLMPLGQWVDCVKMGICQEIPIFQFVYGYFDGVHQRTVLWELERSGVSCERLSCKGWQKSHKITQSRLGGSHSLVNAAIIIIFKTIISPLSSS